MTSKDISGTLEDVRIVYGHDGYVELRRGGVARKAFRVKDGVFYLFFRDSKGKGEVEMTLDILLMIYLESKGLEL